MTLVKTIIESFATIEAERGHSVEYVGTLMNFETLGELVEEVSMWVNETEGDLNRATHYIFSILDTIKS
jgi:hypothetical protein